MADGINEAMIRRYVLFGFVEVLVRRALRSSWITRGQASGTKFIAYVDGEAHRRATLRF